MFLEAGYRMVRCLDRTSIHQRLRMAENCSARSSDNGRAEAYMQFAGRGWLGGPQIFISGWRWTECTFGFLGDPELLIPVVSPAFLLQPRTCVF